MSIKCLIIYCRISILSKFLEFFLFFENFIQCDGGLYFLTILYSDLFQEFVGHLFFLFGVKLHSREYPRVHITLSRIHINLRGKMGGFCY